MPTHPAPRAFSHGLSAALVTLAALAPELAIAQVPPDGPAAPPSQGEAPPPDAAPPPPSPQAPSAPAQPPPAWPAQPPPPAGQPPYAPYPYPYPYGHGGSPYYYPPPYPPQPALPPPPRTRVASPSQLAGGITLTTLGSVGFLVGLVVLGTGRGAVPVYCDQGDAPFECQRRDDSARIVGGAIGMIAGGAGIIVGIPLAIAGGKRVIVDSKPEKAAEEGRRARILFGPRGASVDYRF